MAIVINGSGTVTGISVGGLPDGIVDAGTLATNSVDSAELIDGSIDTAHIATDQITSAILPAGSVLQVVSGTPRASSSTTTTSASWVDAGVSVAITPSSTSSKILVLQTLLAGSDNGGNNYTRVMYTLQRSIGAGSYSEVTDHSSTDGGGNVYGGLESGAYDGGTLYTAASLNHLDSPSTTSECTYLVYFRALGGYGTAYILKGSTLIALEIAG